MTTALCPGSFDPPTLGHVDVIQRAVGVFDDVLVGVIRNPSKTPLFTAEERVDMLSELFAETPGVRVEHFTGLLVDFALARGVDVIVKGLRAASDFEYELQMAQMNTHLSRIDTWFIPTSPAYGYLSSSLIKEVAQLGGERVEELVPPSVWKRLVERLEL